MSSNEQMTASHRKPEDIVNGLNNDHLRIIFRESETFRTSGILEDGLIRHLAQELRKILPLPCATCQSMIIDLSLREIARRWDSACDQAK